MISRLPSLHCSKYAGYIAGLLVLIVEIAIYCLVVAAFCSHIVDSMCLAFLVFLIISIFCYSITFVIIAMPFLYLLSNIKNKNYAIYVFFIIFFIGSFGSLWPGTFLHVKKMIFSGLFSFLPAISILICGRPRVIGGWKQRNRKRV